jgi:hypothetical protein
MFAKPCLMNRRQLAEGGWVDRDLPMAFGPAATTARPPQSTGPWRAAAGRPKRFWPPEPLIFRGYSGRDSAVSRLYNRLKRLFETGFSGWERVA